MEKGATKHAIIYLITLFLVLTLDLITKNWAESFLAYRQVSILPFLHLVLVYNRGAAFGILAETEGLLRFVLLLFVPVLALLITFFYAIGRKRIASSFLMGMIGGGAMGNLYDRVFLGYVRDFIYLKYGQLSWPAFNMADACISLAVFSFILLHYTKRA